MTPYTISGMEEMETFKFRVLNEYRFEFIGAYDVNGNTIGSYSKTSITDMGVAIVDTLAGYVGTSVYEYILSLAFGTGELPDN